MGWIALLVLPALTGCGPKRMRSDFIGFEKAYAETSNREVLLNLARLQNHDTTYFFKLGQISSSYRTQASISGAGNYVIQGTGTGGNATGGGTPGLTFENDPSFTFIPVNDETSAQLLLKPVPAQTLYNLYLQGWRVDQLFRLMVDRIELTTVKSDGKSCAVQVFRNAPPPSSSEADSDRKGYLRDASGYATFLRVSALVYGLQRRGYLNLRPTTTFVPIDDQSYLPVASGGASAADAGAAAGGHAGGGAAADANAPKAADFASAAAKGESWRLQGNRWVLGQPIYSAEFYLIPPASDVAVKDAKSGSVDPYEGIKEDLFSDENLEALREGQAPERVLGILANGFSIEESPEQGNTADSSCAAAQRKGASAHLVLRSLIGIMAAAAQEEDGFDALMRNTHTLPVSTQDEKALTFSDAVPLIERQPSLRVLRTSGAKTGRPLVEVSYAGKNYVIADADDSTVIANRYWNRDMFRLVTQLTGQVTVDISKFPLPGLLQLHSD